jgi:hypothetical protein
VNSAIRGWCFFLNYFQNAQNPMRRLLFRFHEEHKYVFDSIHSPLNLFSINSLLALSSYLINLTLCLEIVFFFLLASYFKSLTLTFVWTMKNLTRFFRLRFYSKVLSMYMYLTVFLTQPQVFFFLLNRCSCVQCFDNLLLLFFYVMPLLNDVNRWPVR